MVLRLDELAPAGVVSATRGDLEAAGITAAEVRLEPAWKGVPVIGAALARWNGLTAVGPAATQLLFVVIAQFMLFVGLVGILASVLQAPEGRRWSAGVTQDRGRNLAEVSQT